ncbi:patatin-like phospholipase family protein [Marispirochaeta sp.]|jgi:NTE family protein|uniref:patatin-like phospholipase family protein n=1 Tax=Marispirochaeta sp. TaxID=2038653 RepID=UPI0029C98E30|nr:patatin-like phospholipase family protein [Marispirochaeta sp.]
MKWALVLSGGGGSGLSHIGVLKGLETLNLKPDLIAGTSIGAVIGGAYACGMEVEDFEELLKDFKIHRYLEGRSFQFNIGAVTRFLQAQEAVNRMLMSRGADGGSRILELLYRITNNASFSETRIPFYCNAVDLRSGREILMHRGSVAEAVRASMAFPGVFTPVERDKLLLCDGAVADNLPVWIPRSLGIKRVIAVNVTPRKTAIDDDIANGFSIFLRAFTIACYGQARTSRDTPTLELVPQNIDRPFDFSSPGELIRAGCDAVMEQKTRIMKITTPWYRHLTG